MSHFFPISLAVVLSLFASSCGSLTSESSSQQKRPEWITDLEESCPESLLCAVGEGSNMTQAQIRGRSELAKIFEVQVNSETRSRSETWQKGEIHQKGFESESESYFSRDLKEVTQQVLQGAKMRKSFAEGQDHFALMAVEKSLVRRKYDSLLRTLDEKMRQNFEKNNRYGLVEAARLWPRRESLKQKLAIVASGPPAPFSWGQLQKRLDSLPMKTVLYDFESENVGPKQSSLGDFIEQELHQLRFRVVESSPAQKADYYLKVRLSSKEIPFNVEGFKRFRFSLALEAKDLGQGEQVGALEVSTEENGRHFQQAFNKTQGEWKSYIENNIHRLNMN